MKKTAFTILQLAITAIILWLVLRDPVKRAKMADAIADADLSWLAAGLVVYGIVELLAGLRWRWLLRVQDITLSWGRLFMLLMIGVFFNFFVPGGTGGDVAKIFYLLKETPGKRAAALLSVLMDRIIGLFSLIVLAGLFIALRWDWLMAHPETARFVWIALAILGGSFCAVALSFVITGSGLVHKIPARFPGRDRMAEVALAYNLYGRAWRPSLAAFGVSFLSHFGYFATFYCAARSFAATGRQIPGLTDLMVIMPVVNTITSMPISFGGVGVREKLFEIFLGNLCGVTPAVAVVISSTGYLLTLAWGLVGGLLYIFYRPSEHARLREMAAEVHALEHQVAESEVAMEIADKR